MPAHADAAARLLQSRLGGNVQRSGGGEELSVMAGTPKAANEAIAALIAAGIEIADFRMGSPSLEEVFFALTGAKAASSEEAERGTG